ncbi:HNH endonuclease [Persicobacter psychrovividus]|uniref:HNH endonuclease n=1 Tax=Persicobacter psychrovividus TaxID=387638 RepID=A0ABM7VL14_9BACT|nr:HNH endonuclease [Persicobacter psychrovividus]
MKNLQKHALLLNADYSALAVCDSYKAFLLVYLNKAELVNQAEGEYLRTINHRYPLPSIIKLKNYVNVPFQKVILSKPNIFKRDNHQCVYCDETKDLTLDHLIPRSKGGPSTWKNLVTACKRCNAKKGDRSIEQANMTLRHQPFRPSFLLMLKNTIKTNKSWRQYLQSS